MDHRDGEFWIRTNDKGRNFRLVVAAAKDPSRASWTEVVPHRDDVMLAGVDLFRDFCVLRRARGRHPHIRVTDFRSGTVAPHRVPGAGLRQRSRPTTASSTPPIYRFAYQSPVVPSSIYDYDPATRERKLLKQVAVLGGFDPSRYRVETTQAPAPDGVQVPMWLLYRKDLEARRDEPGPALRLWLLRGADVRQLQLHGSSAWSTAGWSTPSAYIRGGGELGKKWHDEGG